MDGKDGTSAQENSPQYVPHLANRAGPPLIAGGRGMGPPFMGHPPFNPNMPPGMPPYGPPFGAPMMGYPPFQQQPNFPAGFRPSYPPVGMPGMMPQAMGSVPGVPGMMPPYANMHPISPAMTMPANPVINVGNTITPNRTDLKNSSAPKNQDKEDEEQLVGQSASDWAEYTTDDGRKYYHNQVTKVTTWEKPDVLKNEEEIQKEKEKSREERKAKKRASCPWTEHVHSDGRTYYYNTVTKVSVWEVPEELKALQDDDGKSDNEEGDNSKRKEAAQSVDQNQAQIQSQKQSHAQSLDQNHTQNENQNGRNSPDKKQAKKSEEKEAAAEEKTTAQLPFIGKVNIVNLPVSPVNKQKETVTYATKKEATDAFKQLLEDKEVGADWDWNRAMKKIVTDPRYSALKTIGERKAAFTEYIDKRKKTEREERWMKVKKMREDFTQMLKECEDINVKTSYTKAMAKLENDPRWQQVDSDKEREELYEDYMAELEHKHKEEQKQKRQLRIENFKSLLQEKYDSGLIKYNTSLRNVQPELESDERYKEIDRQDRMAIWDAFVRDLQRREEERKQREREEKRREERMNRDKFRDFLRGAYKAGNITIHTRWRDYVTTIENEEAYKNTEKIAKGLFDDFVEEIETRYREDKRRLQSILNDLDINVTQDTTLESLVEKLSTDDRYHSLDKESARLYLDELREKALSKQKDAEKKKQRLADKFKDLLKRTKSITTSSVYEEVLPELETHQSYQNLETDEERRRVFDYYISKLKRREERRANKKRKAEAAAAAESNGAETDNLESETKKRKILEAENADSTNSANSSEEARKESLQIPATDNSNTMQE